MGTTYVKAGGSWGMPIVGAYRKVAGAWTPATEMYQKQSGVWVNVFSSEIIAVVSANSGTIILSSLFSPSDWSSIVDKRVIINAGVAVSASSLTDVAIFTQNTSLTTTWGGNLTLENRGTLQGVGGAANSGAGGDVIYAGAYGYGTAKKLLVTNTSTGIIRSGGGGGGRGGNGGQGYYYYAATDGPIYSRSPPLSFYTRGPTNLGGGEAWWQGSNLGGGHPDNGFQSGAYFYRPYSEQQNGTVSYYSIARDYTATAYTSGGTGGNGGRGQGADGANAAGVAGGAGGTNAGAGGTGGAGGTYGNNGNVGNTGASGNYTGGSSGTAGGVAGIAYNTATTTMTNSGTILGRII